MRSGSEPGASAGILPRHWHASGAFASHLFDALSSTFLFGEAFFVRSVVAQSDRIDDPELLERVRGFAGQEGQHSRIHDEHVALLLAAGYRLLGLRNRFIDRALRFQGRHAPKLSLAITAALEHLTAILARALLANEARQTVPMNPGIATLFLAFETALRTAYMLGKDGLLFDREVWAQGGRFLLGSDGLLRGAGGAYRAWFRRDFHPDETDDTALIADFAPQVEREIAGPSVGGSG